MVALGEEHGVRTRALVTRMDTPLGRAVGNALEVEEAVEALRGEGPADLMEVTYALARADARAGRHRRRPAAGDNAAAARSTPSSDDQGPGRRPGRAAAAGGTPAGAPRAGAGWVTRLDALAVGVAAWRLGAGRARKEDDVSHTAGVRCLAKPGDYVRPGEPVLELHADDPARFAAALEALDGAR